MLTTSTRNSAVRWLPCRDMVHAWCLNYVQAAVLRLPSGKSKLAMTLVAKHLQRKLDVEGVPITVLALHPGAVYTGTAQSLTPVVVMADQSFVQREFGRILPCKYQSLVPLQTSSCARRFCRPVRAHTRLSLLLLLPPSRRRGTSIRVHS